jgi:hypothetical protein
MRACIESMDLGESDAKTGNVVKDWAWGGGQEFYRMS